MVTDPIGDMLAQIKNASMARKAVVDLPMSKLRLAVANILVQEKYLLSAQVVGEAPHARLKLQLAYKGRAPVLTDTKRISKPGLRWYVNKKSVPRVIGGMGIAILSTPFGVMTGKDAKAKGVGGEVLCEVW